VEYNLKGVATGFLETELGSLETDLKTLHAQLPPLSTSDEIHLISALKAALGDDGSSSNNNNRSGWFDLFEMVPPTLDGFAQNSGGWNSLDRYTSGLLLQLKLKFLIAMKDCIIISNEPASTTGEGQEKEDIHGTPTPAAAARSSDETEEAPVPPVHLHIHQLMMSVAERQLRRREYILVSHRKVKEITECKFQLVLEARHVSPQKEADFLEAFRKRLQRIVEALLSPKENANMTLPEPEGTRQSRLSPNREEEDDEERKAEKRMEKNIKGEMDRLVREYERLMEQRLAAYVELPSSCSPPTGLVRSPAGPVHPPPPPPPSTDSIVIHFGWNYTHIGWIPPDKTEVELLVPPIPCLIGLSEDETEVLYGLEMLEAGRKPSLPSPKEETESGGKQEMASSSSTWLNLKSMLADKEVEWRKGRAKVKSELPLAIFLIHVKTKIEAAIPHPSSSNKYKVILVLPQVLSMVQRGRISDATKLAGFAEDQVHLMKETTAAALAFAHDADIWSPGRMLPIVVCCCPPGGVLDCNANASTADVAIFSNENGIISMGESAGRQGLGLTAVRTELTQFKKRIAPFAAELNKNSVIVSLDDGSYDNVSCSQQEEMQNFRSLHDPVRISSASASHDFLKKIREHLNISTVRYLFAYLLLIILVIERESDSI
jgi:hypothetical protein